MNGRGPANTICLVMSLIGVHCLIVRADEPIVVLDGDQQIRSLIDIGSFAEAESRLRRLIPQADDPVTTPAAVQLEILRRIRLDFPWTEEEVLAQIREEVADVTVDDLRQWRAVGDLQYRKIDGEFRYFRRASSNLFRWNEAAHRRRPSVDNTSVDKATELNRLLEQMVLLAEGSDGPQVSPVRHCIRYELSVQPGHPRMRRGARLRAWLPFPQSYRQQQDVRLIRSAPAPTRIADNGSPHRSIYFEQQIDDPAEFPTLVAEFEFVSSAFCPQLKLEDVQPYDTDSSLYREHTAERSSAYPADAGRPAISPGDRGRRDQPAGAGTTYFSLGVEAHPVVRGTGVQHYP